MLNTENPDDQSDVDVRTAPSEKIIEQSSLTELIVHIEQSHHVFTRSQLSLIGALIEQLDGTAMPVHVGIKHCVLELQADLLSHLVKEERILFPYITAMEQHPDDPPYSCFGSVANPIRMMDSEHDAVKSLLSKLRELSGNYTSDLADVATLYRALAALDKDLMQHIYLEDEVLFPRTLQLEQMALA